MAKGNFSKIRFGTGFDVTDEGGGVIRVNGMGGGGGEVTWEDVGTSGAPFPLKQCGLTAAYQSVAAGATAALSFAGTSTVDWVSLADLTHPVPTIPGIYAVSAMFNTPQSGVPAGGGFWAHAIAAFGEAWASPVAPSATSGAWTSIGFTSYFNGTTSGVTCAVQNYLAAPMTFRCTLWLTKVADATP